MNSIVFANVKDYYCAR